MKHAYKDVTFDQVAQKITGLSFMGMDETPIDSHAAYFPFTASPNLMAIRLATELVPESYGEIAQDADGFGEPGVTHGDWSAFRDSSEDAKGAMYLTACRYLRKYGKEKLLALGLPENLVIIWMTNI